MDLDARVCCTASACASSRYSLSVGIIHQSNELMAHIVINANVLTVANDRDMIRR